MRDLEFMLSVYAMRWYTRYHSCYLSTVEHSNSRVESIRFDSLVVMQFFLVYLLYCLCQNKS